MGSHTPGPWKVDVVKFTGTRDIVAYRIQSGGLPEGSPEANARLIENAPDLLRALIALSRAMEPFTANGSKLITSIQALIAKAEGR